MVDVHRGSFGTSPATPACPLPRTIYKANDRVPALLSRYSQLHYRFALTSFELPPLSAGHVDGDGPVEASSRPSHFRLEPP